MSRPMSEGPLSLPPEGARLGGSVAAEHVPWDRRAAPRDPTLMGRALVHAASKLRTSRWWPIDATAAAACMLMAHRLSPVFQGDPLGAEPLRAAFIYAGSFVLLAYVVGLYDWDVLARSRMTLVLRGLLCAVVAAGVTVVAFYLFYYRPIGRWVVAGAVGLTVPLVLAPHVYVLGQLQRRRRRVLFIGASALTDRMVQAFAAAEHPLCQVVGQWSPDDAHPGNGDDLVEMARSRGVDEIVLATSLSNVEAALLPALRCLPLGCRVRSEADFHEDMFRAVPVAHVSPEWMLSRGWDASDHLTEAAKRLGDVALAFALLVATAPVVLLLALLVKLSGRGPAFYAQTRVGHYGRTFRVLKLRTMRVDAECGEARWAQGDDPRQTGLGRILRRTRLDELPQLLNILVGEMSFVGPRPERPEFVATLEKAIPYYAWRHAVRPGLTGWAQINYPYGSSVEDAVRKLEYDLYYIRNFSLGTDLFIVLRTLAAAMRGAR
jgi:exopolysaccharide biosynthesis polyprenyl glycosylphosphotransferase